MPVYPNHNNAVLADSLYFSVFERKGTKFIKIKRTKTFEKLQDLELEILEEHVWTSSDKLFKISQKYYGTKDFWWALGLINRKPTDGHFKIGDVVLIPRNPNFILEGIR